MNAPSNPNPDRILPLHERRHRDPKFLACDLDSFTLTRLTVVRYGVAGHYITRLLQPRPEPYLVAPSTFAIHDFAPGREKAAYAMPDGTSFDVLTVPAPKARE